VSLARVGLWIVTLAALALCVRAWWIDVVPGLLLVSSLGLVTLVVGLGIANPRWEMFGFVLDRIGDSPASAALFLECSGEALSAELLDLLDAADAHATFVVPKLEANDAVLLAEATRRGHDVAAGTSRELLGLALVSVRAVEQRLERLQQHLLQLIGRRPRALLVPRRLALPGLLQGGTRSRLIPVTATRREWRSIAQNPVRPGEIACVCLTHLPDEVRQSLASLRVWLNEARGRGIRFVTLEEVLRPPAT
jgi:peptidoglycan/xylan/chitin deacetylase (PgdA/CDA1 family)